MSFAVIDWLDVFTRNEYKDLILESLEFCQKKKGMEIHAWCIMTNHIHLIFRSLDAQNPELLLGDFKRFTSRSITKAIAENPRESRKEFLLAAFKKEGEKTPLPRISSRGSTNSSRSTIPALRSLHKKPLNRSANICDSALRMSPTSQHVFL